MRNKITTVFMLVILILSVVACSTPAKEADPMDKQIAYNDASVAVDKVKVLFHKTTAADGTPILDPATGGRDKAKELLLGYFDAPLVDKIMAHYVTDQTVEDNVVLNKGEDGSAVPFFNPSLIDSPFNAVKVEGSKEEFKITTPENKIYTLKWQEDKGRYIVTNYE
ncbi:hypothetical protein [Paenibacillus guangzhouensis]|uniref:hypothetical protein n=1 Tax=Paenibacillus guangzhouensis TaxID=1473112 RepID=UPI001266CDE3|nr:hypothetical protein [Paenibacillus guangzhouensis]